ncbi:MAG: hypothetical protein A3J75_08215 [Acidobacteria bacterium RBG_16_68_9]|nr:MAG: hypothetical protein A3J75_08215 [Acidobacteria bacterium RBG_16_68_9]
MAVLDFARQHLADTRPSHATGLTRKALRAFVRELSEALADYRELRDRMAESNIRLVNMLARQYRHPTITFLDLVQEGTLGLFRAIEKYEPNRKVKFSTYAVWWIWQAIARAVDNQGALIRTPVHWSQFRRRLSREAQAVAGDRAPTGLGQLPSTQGIDPTRVTMMAQTFRFVSTDAPAGEDDQRPLETLLASGQLEPEEQLFRTDLSRQLDEAIATLPSREAYILRHRFGLRDDQSQTLEEIGTLFGVSRERVRQLESRALKQLREVCREQGLQAYLQ